MSRLLRAAAVLLFCLFLAPVLMAEADLQGSRDYPGLTLMPAFLISEYRTSQFDSHTFKVMDGKKEKDQAVEGRRYDYRYDLSRGATPVPFGPAARPLAGGAQDPPSHPSTIQDIRPAWDISGLHFLGPE